MKNDAAARQLARALALAAKILPAGPGHGALKNLRTLYKTENYHVLYNNLGVFRCVERFSTVETVENPVETVQNLAAARPRPLWKNRWLHKNRRAFIMKQNERR